ncbi:PREDICTED: auxin-responsive [Prunus dulcis]|uniref:PREDICTED: auxin-responsive n=1 Tax=Prunus dulcis TaxID=3755 RepID=A0A5E4FWL1_PRUDU|nr:PREDICTED: auxin-responsive [Prunus dulcis]
MDNIISPKRLIRIVSKWQKRDAMGRTKNSSPRVAASNNMLNNMVGEKGTFVIYTIDGSRFVLPLSYLSNCIFQELFKMSEEEFGLSSGRGPIILPCYSVFMNYILSFLQRGTTGDLEKALVANSLFSSSCSSSKLHQGQIRNPTIPLWLLLST